jgi:hypothetical protein
MQLFASAVLPRRQSWAEALSVNFGAGMKSPHPDFLLPGAGLCNVISRLHPLELVHFHAESFLDA